MKAKLLRIAIVMWVASSSFATSANTAMPGPGTYDGKIIKSSMCALGQGDKRACHRLKIELAPGRLIYVQLWGAAVTIYDAKGRAIYRVDNDSSQGEMWEKFSKGTSYLTVGTLIRMNISSCSKSNCDVETIRIR